jgi:hypothetical protein
MGMVFVGNNWFYYPAFETVAVNTQKSMSEYFHRFPQYHVKAVKTVIIDRRFQHEYFGIVILNVGGKNVSQDVQVHLMGHQMQWQTSADILK